ncbi:peptidoglycan-binding protein [Niallia taxi]|uniref:peptidoglycan-binding protein n=1 Tax=Niallia taxi TaxID=2499688 RepID=UPI002041273E|nr:peptidoglycan-binding protein [Niallia taxi]MCM3216092.1 peptidoglycan-binding protein [Niallia taxi]
MTFIPTYHERNLKNLAQLGDNTKMAAMTWYAWLIANEIDVLIYETIRTLTTQKGYLASGKSQTLKSYHIVGQAMDFVPVDGKETLWNGYGKDDIKRAIAKAKELGFKWGGDWTGFVDKPHLEFHYKGYGTDTFKTKGATISLGVTETIKEEVVAVKDVVKADTDGDANIKKLQNFLNGYTKKASFNKLIVDGYKGPKTKTAAIRVLQYFSDVKIDGVFGKKSKAAAPIVKKGTTWSKWTRLVQGMLYYNGFNPQGIDGVFGNDTVAAVKAFQKANSLDADGVVGPATFAKFFS